MKRLLLFSSEFPPGPGGIGTHSYQLALHMQKFGWEVHVLTNQDYVSVEEINSFNRTQDFGISQATRTSSYFKDALKRWKQLIGLIKTWHPDVLVVTGERQVWLTAALQFWNKFFLHTDILPWCAVWYGVIPPHNIAKQIACWSFGQADLTITISQYSLGQMLSMGVRPHRNLVITLGADENSFQPNQLEGLEMRAKLGLTDTKIILTVGHVTQRKGQDIVIRALPKILRTIPNVHYLIAGLPTLQEPLEKVAEELGVSKNVHFLGRIDQDELNPLYNACDVFVLASRHSPNGEFEGYGIVAVEAALCSKPSVVAGNSGLMEAVQQEQTGFVVPENDIDATAQAIRKLLQNPALSVRMGEQARQRALSEQTWLACMSKYNKALIELIVDNGEKNA